MQIYQTESLKSAGLNMLANNKQSSGNLLFLFLCLVIVNLSFFLGLQLKKPEIISILKHKNDITSNSQLFNGKV